MSTAETRDQRLSILVMVPGLRLPAWASAVLDELVGLPGFRFTLVHGAPPPRTDTDSLMLRTLEQLDRRLTRPRPDAFRMVDGHRFAQVFDTHDCRGVQAGAWVTAFEGLSPCAVLWLYDCPPPLEPAETVPAGVWYIETGHGGSVRPGFWEVFEKHPTTSVHGVVCLKGGARRVVYRAVAGTSAASLSENRNALLWKAAAFFPRMLRELRQMGTDAFVAQPEQAAQATRTVPGNLLGLKLAGRLALRRTAGKLARLVQRRQWRLYYHEGPGFPHDAGHYRPLVPPADRFWADPFPLKHEGRRYLFFEEMTWRGKKGTISVMPMDGPDLGKVTTILDLPYHLSYPYVFAHEGRVYLVPESRADASIQLWEATRFPYQWRLRRTLMRDVSAVDATLHFHEGYWWLFTSMVPVEGASSCDELYVFYCRDFLTDTWTPHPANPVVRDVRHARPAGRLFSHAGRLYRPAQDCAQYWEQGGQGVRIQEVEVLNPQAYRETTATHFCPLWDPRVKRVHTYNHCDGLVVVDGLVALSPWRR